AASTTVPRARGASWSLHSSRIRRRCARAGDTMARKQAPFAAPQREDTMKIDAVELTLFAWDDIPPTRYTQGTHNTSGRSNLGLLRIKTDDGVEGNAF